MPVTREQRLLEKAVHRATNDICAMGINTPYDEEKLMREFRGVRALAIMMVRRGYYSPNEGYMLRTEAGAMALAAVVEDGTEGCREVLITALESYEALMEVGFPPTITPNTEASA